MMFKKDFVKLVVVLAIGINVIPKYSMADSFTGALTAAVEEIPADINSAILEGTVINVKQYYKETDNGNWTLAFQRVLDLAKDGKAITLYVPKGSYKIKESCIVYSNTTIKMDDSAVLILDSAHRFFVNGEKNKEYSGYNGNGNISILGGILDVNKKNRAAISFAHGENIVIENVRIKNVVDGHGFELSALKNVRINNCRFENFKNVDVVNKDYVEAIQLDINTEKAFPAFGGYDETINDNITIENCYFGTDDNPPEGFGPWPTGVGSHASIKNKWNRNIVIKNCTFEGATYSAIRNFSWANTTIQNNTFRNCVKTITVNMNSKNKKQFGNIILEGNRFINSGYNEP
jgi:hypothetical protein